MSHADDPSGSATGGGLTHTATLAGVQRGQGGGGRTGQEERAELLRWLEVEGIPKGRLAEDPNEEAVVEG